MYARASLANKTATNMFSGFPDLMGVNLVKYGDIGHEIGPTWNSITSPHSTVERRRTKLALVTLGRADPKTWLYLFICHAGSFAHQGSSRSSFVADITALDGRTTSNKVGVSAARSGSPKHARNRFKLLPDHSAHCKYLPDEICWRFFVVMWFL